ncbi:hypothetical protein OAX11_04655 [Flavobacteriaceae bacterium]|nr:hypothetical protein [Flavobacteriaceae bacterium]
MKKILFTRVLLFLSIVSFAQKQDSIPVIKTFKIAVASKTQITKNLAIELVEVLSDSRCPKNVQCIRAGEAFILVNIYKNKEKVIQEKLEIFPRKINEYALEKLSDVNSKVMDIALLPYPNGINKIDLSNYCLQLTIAQE